MTTGNNTLDARVSTSNRYYAYSWGPYYSRVWNGSDRPRIPPSYLYKEVVLRKHGKIEKILVRYRGKPPARSRSTPPHPYSMTLRKYYDPNCTIVRGNRTTDNYDTSMSANVGFPTSSVAWSSNHDLMLIGKLRDAIQGSDFNIGVFLAESNQTLGMIGSSAVNIARSISFAQKGNFTEAFRAISQKRSVKGKIKTNSRTAADLLLELQYGWVPLLKDVQSAAEFLAHQTSVPFQSRVVVRHRTRSPLNWGYLSPIGYGEESGQIVAYLSNVDSVSLSGLTDVASIAWEKLPFSFVADWFIPVGNYLSALGVARSLSGTFVTTRRRTIRCDGATVPAGSGIDFILGLSNYKYLSVDVTRTVSSSLSVPLPSMKGLSKSLTFRHAVTSLALLEQRRPILSLFDRFHGRSSG